MGWRELDTAARDVLIALYSTAAHTVDDLPYTPEFDRLLVEFNRRTGNALTHHDFWRALSSARKTGVLKRKER
jgi:hypothetical protein